MPAPDTRSEAMNETVALRHHADTIDARVDLHVRARPHAVAVVCGDRRTSYQELGAASDRVAARLRSDGIGTEDLVAIWSDRSDELLIAMLGVLKCGAGFVPIDPLSPPDRVTFILQDTNAKALLAPAAFAERIGAAVPSMWVSGSTAAAVTPVRRALVDDRQCAYVMYTSGSTGRPKGVVITHRNVVGWLTGRLPVPLDERTVTLHVSSPAFDASAFEIWSALLFGGCCVVVEERVPTVEHLRRQLQEHRVNTILLTTGLFHHVVDEDPTVLASVAHVLTGGERLSVQHARRAKDALPATRIYNAYGPTETTTFVTLEPISAVDVAGQSVPIGRPIEGAEVLILDEELQLVADGSVGELCVGGWGLARGYLRRPGLTAERFVPHPFDRDGAARLYRTGDLARWGPDGTLEFVGRVDEQVKIRGFRVEPKEIEAVLREHSAVLDAVVVPYESNTGDRRIAAYVASRDTGVDEAGLRSYVASRLPPYMVPAAFTLVSELPRTPAGKVDRRALPSPVFPRRSGASSPRTPTAELLAAIWEDVLEVSAVESTDDFFLLGGHSLLASRVATRIAELFDIDVPVSALFDSPTLASLANWVDETVLQLDARSEGGRTSDRRSRDAAVRHLRTEGSEIAIASHAQEWFWLLDQLYGRSALYNVAWALEIDGLAPVEAVRAAVGQLVERHAILRTRLVMVDGVLTQVIDPAETVAFSELDLATDNGGGIEVALRAVGARPFALATEAPLRVHYCRVPGNKTVVLFVMHHVACDAWSNEIIVADLRAMYEAALAETPVKRPAPTLRYTEFALDERARLSGDRLERLVEYWKGVLRGAPDRTSISSGTPPVPTRPSEGSTVHRAIGPADRSLVAAFRRSERTTAFTVYLCALALLLGRRTKLNDLVIGSPMTIRNSRELEGLVGPLINMLPLRLRLTPEQTVRDALRATRGTVLDAFTHAELPFAQIVQHVRPARVPGQTPVVQTTFGHEIRGPREFTFGGLRARRIDLALTGSKFDLTLIIDESPESAKMALEFNTNVLTAPAAEEMLDEYAQLVRALPASLDRTIAQLDVAGGTRGTAARTDARS